MLKLQELLFRVKECTIDLRPIQTFDSVITHARGLIWLLRPSMELQVCLLLPKLHKWPHEFDFPSSVAPHPQDVKLQIEFKIHLSQAGSTQASPEFIRNATKKYRNTNRRITVVPRPDTTAMEEYWSSRY
ncbi:hypothetical protein QCA50_010356 [Cerrena zonata]|uniref:Uncharacterized protein n=1 Tax=Cerrena zonata TaxID=2478898 RepID=A0AAW0G155_9APHY